VLDAQVFTLDRSTFREGFRARFALTPRRGVPGPPALVLIAAKFESYHRIRVLMVTSTEVVPRRA
jgi:hypothetical protein